LTVTVNTHRKPEPAKDTTTPTTDVPEKSVVGSGTVVKEKEASGEMVAS